MCQFISEGTGRGTERRTIIWGDYKLIHDFFTDENQLFDIRQDPEDKINLAESRPAVVERLKRKLFEITSQSRENRQEIFQKPEPAGPPLGDVVGY